MTESLIQQLAADPWARITSSSGMPCDELISALQKSIRQGLVENALLVAREMFLTSAELRHHLWSRLQIIACEDTGDGTFTEPVVIDSLYRIYRRTATESPDRWVILVHAVRFLAEQTKDRTSSELAALTMLWHAGGRLPQIPDAAVDMHTARGRTLGRSIAHYMREGARVENERAGRSHHYYEQWLALVIQVDGEVDLHCVN